MIHIVNLSDMYKIALAWPEVTSGGPIDPGIILDLVGLPKYMALDSFSV